MKSLFEQLREYGESSHRPYHMPGHKRQVVGDLPEAIASRDITEIEGFDNLHQPEEILLSLQQEAARMYGAEESFYLVNGSTCGILSAISAALPREGHLLMARGSHKSAYHAAYLRNLQITYLYSKPMEEYDIYEAIEPEQVEKALQENPEIGAVFMVSPTYEGRIAKVKEIAEIVHRRGIPLIVDEAHGAHLGFHENFALNSCQAGADIVIHSVHKTLPAMTQAALLHVNGKLIDRNRLRRFLRIYQSSSPSYLLMASIDNAMRVVKQDGRRMFAEFYTQYTKMLRLLSENCHYLRFVPFTDDNAQDIGKLVISTKSAHISGQRIYDILLEKFQIQLEMAAPTFCLAMFTVADDAESYERMTEALLFIDKMIAQEPIESYNKSVGSIYTIPEASEKISLAEAWDTAGRWTALEESVGFYVGEFINLYPPGIPLLVPGERMNEELCRNLLQYLEEGLNVQGISIKQDPEGKTFYEIRVIA